MASPSQLASSIPGPGLLFCAGLSAALHLGPLTAGAVIVPPPCAGEETEYGLTMAQREELSRLLATADEKEIERREAELAEDGDGAGSGTRTRCEEGTMGNPGTSGSGHGFFVERPEPSPDAVRAAALRDASEFAVTTLRGGSPELAAAWTSDDEPTCGPFDSGPCQRVGHRGQAPDPAFPLPRLSGVGDESDARGADLALGLGSLGVLGPAGHTAPRRAPERGPFFGFAGFRSPKVRFGAMSISGRLPAEVVQRVLRRHLGRLRRCYEDGLRDNPVLQGRIAARLVIGVDGALSSVGNAGSDLPDSGVVSCVVRTYRGLRFPQPEGGVVTVVVPVVLEPD